MALNTAQARQHLQQFQFQKLFINELGWDKPGQNVVVKVGADTFPLEAVAQKRGVQIFHCLPDASGKIPDYPLRRKIDQQAAKSAQEHLLIFTDAKKTTQIWQWMSKEDGKAAAVHQQPFYAKTSGDALLQKLDRITFSLSDEERLTLTGVTFKLKDAFYKERLTKNFYKVFEQQHQAFVGFIQNIPDTDLQKWYASVMINRLMFLYFIQEKGFLDGDRAYLQNKLAASHGHYYKEFLCPLFFEGFAKRDGERSAAMNTLLGRVPYLNGGLFAKHQIEEQHGQALDIPDAAFQKLFAFFDAYDWRLDDRPSAGGTEINPDVLGYIFEKYINQKQMGAYYTKEDITEYIGKNTILPFLFDRTRQECAIAFDGAHSLWHLLSDDPDRYIYPAVKHGVTEPLPAVIAQGVNSIAERGEWNRPAPADFALPTEIWREVVARRQRYEAVRAILAAGEFRDINDLITHNLNIRQFAQDALEQWEDADFLWAFWEQIRKITVLDPTCGSGAFLFAALEILEPLYEACLDRMEAFVADANQLNHPRDFQDFRKTLDDVAKHPNRSYFIYKSIIVSNLYGVDIMEEATEICKLRLFLKLAAQIEPDPDKPNFGVEPLPDIDFNIRAGNTLVGFATEEQTEAAFNGGTQRRMTDDTEEKAWTDFKHSLQVCDGLFQEFSRMQEGGDFDSSYVAQHKAALRAALIPLRDKADSLLSYRYGAIGKTKMEAWRKSAQPFHWYVEFFGVMKRDGFDTIIGNPPYVEYSKVKKDYQIKGYQTEDCGNLYANVMERSLDLLQEKGVSGLIVPTAVACTDRMLALRNIYKKRNDGLFVSHFAIRPSKLFDGVDQRVSIVVASKIFGRIVKVTRYNKWVAEERPNVFFLVSYSNSVSVDKDVWCKIGLDIGTSILNKIEVVKTHIGSRMMRTSLNVVYYKNTGVNHWLCVTPAAPKCFRGSELSSSTRETHIYVNSESEADTILCLLNSSTFFWRYQQLTNCRDFNPSDISNFPVPATVFDDNFSRLAKEIGADLELNSGWVTREQNQTGAIRLQFFRPRLSKPIIDQIDRVLAKHYGFTDEETDFIINYDIKYRMGKGGDEGDAE